MSANGSTKEEDKGPMSITDKIKKFLKGILGWLSIIFVMVLPGFAGYTIAAAVALGWAVLMLGITRYQQKIGVIKIWPKILDIGLIFLWLALLIIQLVAHPNDQFDKSWNGVIVNGGLSVIVFFTILVKQPFTLQYAKDSTPEETWTNKGFIWVCTMCAYIWLASFLLGALFPLLSVVANPNNNQTLITIFANVLPIVILVLTFKVQKRFIDWAKSKQPKPSAPAPKDEAPMSLDPPTQIRSDDEGNPTVWHQTS